jgi:hypothetical protein
MCIVRNIKRQTKLVLSVYCYEIQHNVFAGKINFRLLQEFLKYFKFIKGNESATFFYTDKNNVEGFKVQYFNCTNYASELDGVTFFKAL